MSSSWAEGDLWSLTLHNLNAQLCIEDCSLNAFSTSIDNPCLNLILLGAKGELLAQPFHSVRLGFRRTATWLWPLEA